MLNYHQIKFLTYERQRGFLAEAEARRSAKACALSRPALAQRIRCWLGDRLVHWGSARAESGVSIVDSCITASSA
jgi:hypothetical protein